MNAHIADLLNVVVLSSLVAIAIAVSYVKDLLYAAILLGAYSPGHCPDLAVDECARLGDY